MKFRRIAEASTADVDRAIAMIWANESPCIHEMASLLVFSQTGVTLDEDVMDESCNRVADVASELGLWPEDVQTVLEKYDSTPVQDGVDWFTIEAALKAEESQAG
jgi:hypothetical protein